MNIKSEEEWAERAAAFLKHKLQESEVTYIELAKRLKKHGFKTETEASVQKKRSHHFAGHREPKDGIRRSDLHGVR